LENRITELNNSSPHLIDGVYSFSDLVDIPKLKALFEAFHKITGFTIGLLDNNTLEILISIGWRKICKDFHRPDPNASIHCKSSNKILFTNLDQPQQIHINKCENGLYDGATPIIIDGVHLANLSTGQLLFEKPNKEYFRLQANKYNFDEKSYLAAVDEVLITTEDKMKEVMRYLASVATMIAEVGLERLRTNRIERKLVQHQKLEAIGRLAGGIAHDFNNILTIINGECCNLIEIQKENQLLVESLKIILNAGQKAADITKKLLTFSRSEKIQPKKIDVNVIINEMMFILNRLTGENITIKFESECDQIHILIDPSQLNQIILNFVTNSVEAMPSGGSILIRSRILKNITEFDKEQIPLGDYVCISVTDTGIGIDDEQIKHIFEPFYTTKKEKGTGLGLSIIYGIIKQNHGYISVKSTKNIGTTFQILFLLIND